MPRILTNEEMLAELDAYGHLFWAVGFGGDNDDRGDWMACFDFNIFEHPEKGTLIAYHVVVSSDSGGFIDTLEARIVEDHQAPYNLPDHWMGLAIDHAADRGGVTDEEMEEALQCNRSWNAALDEYLERPRIPEQPL